MRASRSPSSSSSPVQTPHGSLHSTASSKSRLESSSPWRWPLRGRSIDLSLQNKTPSKLYRSGGRVARDPPDLAGGTPKPFASGRLPLLEIHLADADNARIVRPA